LTHFVVTAVRYNAIMAQHAGVIIDSNDRR